MSTLNPRDRSIGAVLPRSGIRAVAELATANQIPYPLHFGESSVPTPLFIVEAGRAALAAGFTFYPPGQGYRDVREAVARAVTRRWGLSPDPDTEVMVTGSGVTGSLLACLSTVGPGDEVLVLTPVWPNVVAHIRMAGATPVFVPLGTVGGRWTLPVDRLATAVTPRTRAIVVTTPSNPTGWVASDADVGAIVEIAAHADLWILSDEVYSLLAFGTAAAPTFFAHRDKARVVVTNSFSKTYSMTGWRVGYSMAPADTIRRMVKMQEFVVAAAPAAAQRAALAALDGGDAFVDSERQRIARNATIAHDALRNVEGISVATPQGAMYLYFGLPMGIDADDVWPTLVRSHGVSAVPGTAFYDQQKNRMRICVATPEPDLLAALEALTRGLRAVIDEAETSDGVQA